jgi:hypothetical protein
VGGIYCDPSSPTSNPIERSPIFANQALPNPDIDGTGPQRERVLGVASRWRSAPLTIRDSIFRANLAQGGGRRARHRQRQRGRGAPLFVNNHADDGWGGIRAAGLSPAW